MSHPTDIDVVELSIVLPCYREAENLPALLPGIKEAAAALTPKYEVLIVDTEQPMDDTAAICAQYGVRYVNRRGGNSYGDAVRTLVTEARGTYMLCMDADGSHDPVYFASMWAKRHEADITIGSRYVKGGHTENPLILIWMSYVINVVFRMVFSIRVKDMTNSFRLYRRAVLDGFHFRSNDFDILEEILIDVTIRDGDSRIVEVRVVFGRRKAGESKRKLVSFAFGYLKTLLRLRALAAQTRKELGKK